MRIFEFLTQVIEQAVPACKEEFHARIDSLLVQQDAFLGKEEMLSAAARGGMIASLREELTWKARLGFSGQSLDEAATRWLAAQQQMLHRFEQDRSQLERLFFVGRPIGQIAAIGLDLSDRHDGAHAVAILTFESESRIVYKPRPLETESWFYNFSAELNTLAPPFSFAVPRSLNREGYGWVEFAEHRSCRSHAELESYYRHAGALLCLLRLLRVSDCHFQNLVAQGEMPVLVDAETLFHPIHDGKREFTVADTIMLPQLERAYDLGALSSITPQQIAFHLPDLETSRVTVTPRENLPFIEGQTLSPHLFVEQMAEGFSATWQFFECHREAIAGFLASASKLTVRILARDTTEYYRQMLLLALGMETDPTLSTAELGALRRFEVPRFMTTVNAAETGAVGSGFEAVLQEIVRIDNTGLERQLKMLRLLWTIYGGMRDIREEAVKMTQA